MTRVVIVCVTVKMVRAKEGTMRVAELWRRPSVEPRVVSASDFEGLSLPAGLSLVPPDSTSEGVLAAGASLVLPVASLIVTGSEGAAKDEVDPSSDSMSEVHAVLSVLALWGLLALPTVCASDLRPERLPELGPSVAEAVPPEVEL